MNYQKMLDAIEAFEPGAGNAPIVYAQTEVNEKIMSALAGRKLRLWTGSTTKVFMVCVLIWLASVVLMSLATRNVAGGAFAGAWAGFIVIWFFRATLLTVSESGLNLYFLEMRMTNAKVVVTDKLTLPLAQAANVRVKTGRVLKNTHITLEFLIDGKKRRLRITAPRRLRKAPEHQDNLQDLLALLQKNFDVGA